MSIDRPRRGLFWLAWCLGMVLLVAALLLLPGRGEVAGGVVATPSVALASVRGFFENFGRDAPDVGGVLGDVVAGIVGVGEAAASAVGGLVGSLLGGSSR